MKDLVEVLHLMSANRLADMTFLSPGEFERRQRWLYSKILKGVERTLVTVPRNAGPADILAALNGGPAGFSP